MNVYLRYFFPDTVFRDAQKGTWLERAEAIRYNISHSRFAPVFCRRWTMLSLVLLVMAQTAWDNELETTHVVLATAGVCALAMGIIFLSVWMRMKSK